MNYPPPPLPGLKKSRHSIGSTQNGALEFAARPGYSHCLHTEKVREAIFKKHFKILLLTKLSNLKRHDSHITL